MDWRSDEGSVEVISALGAAITATPVTVALIADSAVADNLSFIIAFFISILTLGAGVGRVYKTWRQSIIENSRRDDLLTEVAQRLANMEERQINIQDQVNRQAAIIQAEVLKTS